MRFLCIAWTENILIALTKAGERYQDILYPGGIQILADGEKIAHIYKVNVSGVLAASYSAAIE